MRIAIGPVVVLDKLQSEANAIHSETGQIHSATPNNPPPLPTPRCRHKEAPKRPGRLAFYMRRPPPHPGKSLVSLSLPGLLRVSFQKLTDFLETGSVSLFCLFFFGSFGGGFLEGSFLEGSFLEGSFSGFFWWGFLLFLTQPTPSIEDRPGLRPGPGAGERRLRCGARGPPGPKSWLGLGWGSQGAFLDQDGGLSTKRRGGGGVPTRSTENRWLFPRHRCSVAVFSNGSIAEVAAGCLPRASSTSPKS